MPQLYHIVPGLETLATNTENEHRSPISQRKCHHGVQLSQSVIYTNYIGYRCPTSEDINYQMTRVAVDVVDLFLIDSGTALYTWVIHFLFSI